jgi:hypothetical protein
MVWSALATQPTCQCWQIPFAQVCSSRCQPDSPHLMQMKPLLGPSLMQEMILADQPAAAPDREGLREAGSAPSTPIRPQPDQPIDTWQLAYPVF